MIHHSFRGDGGRGDAFHPHAKTKKSERNKQSENLNPACRFLLPPPAHPHFIYSNIFSKLKLLPIIFI